MTWIGPSAKGHVPAGSKLDGRRVHGAMRACTPPRHVEAAGRCEEAKRDEAKRIGYPIMLKGRRRRKGEGG